MSETISPANSSRGAAQQIIIELIRAGKLSAGDGGDSLVALYEKLVQEYDRINKK